MHHGPLVLNLAPTGMVPTREMTPYVPLTPEEIVKDVLAAAEVGITIAHLHARDEYGKGTCDKEVYARIIGGIREKRTDLILCASMSGRYVQTAEGRSEVLDLPHDLLPDMASLTMCSLNFPRQASLNAPDVVQALAERCLERGVKPEVEIFDLGMVNYMNYLIDKDLLRPPYYANLLFGNVATAQANLLSIAACLQGLPKDTTWALAGLGASQIGVMALCAGMAPGARTGLEDYLWLDAGRKTFSTNLQLVERMHMLAAQASRSIMTPDALRKRLGLKFWSLPRPAAVQEAPQTYRSGVSNGFAAPPSV